MNRTQKKCLIASLATHGLLLSLLFFGPAFLTSNENAQPNKFITMIPLGTQISDAPTSIAGPPAPAVNQPPPQAPPQQSQPVPNPPQVVKPPQPNVAVVKPPPTRPPPLQKAGDDFTPVKPKVSDTTDFTPVKPSSTKPPKVKPKDDQEKQMADAQAAAQAAAARKMANAISGLSTQLSKDSMVQIGTSGDSGADNANYRDLVYSKYTAAWVPPASLTDESATVTVRVTISRDGQVARHEIITPSGNTAMDKSIDTTLNNVTFIYPFPAGSKDLARTYSIKFNLSAKKAL